MNTQKSGVAVCANGIQGVLDALDYSEVENDCQCGHPRCSKQRARAAALVARSTFTNLVRAAYSAMIALDPVAAPGSAQAASVCKLAEALRGCEAAIAELDKEVTP